jgi:prepilin-type N-terminal cleavage/methylation domain-containing protein
MKQNSNHISRQNGFTIIEIIVVVAMMAILATVVTISFNRQRNQRNITLAQNETVTNIRKVQSYMLSSRNLPSGEAAKFYIIKFEKNVNYYTVQAVDNQYNFHGNLERISLPNGVVLGNITLQGAIPDLNPDCIQLIFGAPFGQMYINYHEVDACDATGQDTITTLRDPVAIFDYTKALATITLSNPDANLNNNIVINTISGRIHAQ